MSAAAKAPPSIRPQASASGLASALPIGAGNGRRSDEDSDGKAWILEIRNARVRDAIFPIDGDRASKLRGRQRVFRLQLPRDPW